MSFKQFQVYQKLEAQGAVIKQNVSGLSSGTQHQQLKELSNVSRSVMQQIVHIREQVLQAPMVSATSPCAVFSVGAGGQPTVDQFLKNLVGHQTKEFDAHTSRLVNQWKLPEASDHGQQAVFPMLGSHSSGGTSTNPLSKADHIASGIGSLSLTDATWLPLSSSTWSSPPPTGSASGGAAVTEGGGNCTAGAESSTASDVGSTSVNAAAAAAALDIEEFVPGKPWQGPNTKSVEDDPYITPGSVARSAFSAVSDNQAMNILGETRSSESLLSERPMSSISKSGSSNDLVSSFWSLSSSSCSAPTLEPWNPSSFGAQLQYPPPGLGTNVQNKSLTSSWQQQPHGINRSVSWAPGDNHSNVTSKSSYILNSLGFFSAVIFHWKLFIVCLLNVPTIEFSFQLLLFVSHIVSSVNYPSSANVPSTWIILKNIPLQVC